MKVKVLVDVEFIPAGSVIQDVKELKKHFKGIWTSMFGTYEVKIPKKDCEIIHE